MAELDLGMVRPVLVDNLTSTRTDAALTANQGKVLSDQVSALALAESHIHVGGNFACLARTDGRFNLSIPFQGDYTSVNASASSVAGTIYGTKSAGPCTFTIQDLSIASGSKVIYFNLLPNVQASTYTDLAKMALVNIDGFTLTLS